MKLLFIFVGLKFFDCLLKSKYVLIKFNSSFNLSLFLYIEIIKICFNSSSNEFTSESLPNSFNCSNFFKL